MASSAAREESLQLGEEDAVFRWRAEQFRQLGFTEIEAAELAASEADLGQARYLVGSGFSPHVAFRILL